MSAAVQAKEAGQELSLLDLLDTHREAFAGLLRALRPGVEFSVNDLRGDLDFWGIPEKSRAGLFAGACKAGLIAQVWVDVGGRRIAVTEPSTGAKTHAAHVRRYVRLGGGP